MPRMSSCSPPNETVSPSVVSPPPRTVTGTRCLCAAAMTSDTIPVVRAISTPRGRP